MKTGNAFGSHLYRSKLLENQKPVRRKLARAALRESFQASRPRHGKNKRTEDDTASAFYFCAKFAR